MKERENIPYAPVLIESMRSIGYSFETAVADIIDNSIAANAKKVIITLKADMKNQIMTFLDDGNGMNDEELFEAMRYGSKNPLEERSIDDLGRFGLGLKSASLSQCRKLTVISKQNKHIYGYCWDIDKIALTGNWSVLEYQEDEILELSYFNQLSDLKHGTLVVWENFDKIAKTSVDLNETLLRLMELTKEHISLIYHRILSSKFQIVINGIEVKPLDPFLLNHKATQLKREKKINVDGHVITVKPIIIPHINKLSTEDIKNVGGKENLRSQQGFYIYRNKRLIIWGTWFRLKRKQELFKLARVMVDIPNTLDYLWDIDVKKSKATLPDKIKTQLLNAVIESTGVSETVHEYKGRRINEDNITHLWEMMETRDGIKLTINVESPYIKTFIDTLEPTQVKGFMNVLENIEQCVPAQYIYTQYAKGNNLITSEDQELLEDAKSRIDTIMAMNPALKKDYVIDILVSNEPYATNEYVINELNKMRSENKW